MHSQYILTTFPIHNSQYIFNKFPTLSRFQQQHKGLIPFDEQQILEERQKMSFLHTTNDTGRTIGWPNFLHALSQGFPVVFGNIFLGVEATAIITGLIQRQHDHTNGHTNPPCFIPGNIRPLNYGDLYPVCVVPESREVFCFIRIRVWVVLYGK